MMVTSSPNSRGSPSKFSPSPNDGHSPSASLSASKRLLASQETRALMSLRFAERDGVKSSMLSHQASYRVKKFQNKMDLLDAAVAKTSRSPFLVNLLAENERIDEENKVRMSEQVRRERVFEERKEAAKNGIILKALQEASDLDALRREKRVIMEEERRLKALLDIEKTNSHRKEDKMAAARAERQRKLAKAEYRRTANIEMLEDHRGREKDLLRVKHEIKRAPDNTFTSFGN